MKRRERGDSQGFHEEAVQELAGEANPDRFLSWDFRALVLLWLRRREFKEGDNRMGAAGGQCPGLAWGHQTAGVWFHREPAALTAS